MNDLKEFLQDLRPKFICDNYDNRLFNNIQEELGLFFWERGGKQHLIESSNDLNEAIEEANIIIKQDEYLVPELCNAQDFLDCVACLGEDKVKELIEGLK